MDVPKDVDLGFDAGLNLVEELRTAVVLSVLAKVHDT